MEKRKLDLQGNYLTQMSNKQVVTSPRTQPSQFHGECMNLGESIETWIELKF